MTIHTFLKIKLASIHIIHFHHVRRSDVVHRRLRSCCSYLWLLRSARGTITTKSRCMTARNTQPCSFFQNHSFISSTDPLVFGISSVILMPSLFSSSFEFPDGHGRRVRWFTARVHFEHSQSLDHPSGPGATARATGATASFEQ